MNMKKKPVNTTKQAYDNPSAIVIEAMLKGTSQMIYDQEAVGQESFVGSETLPSKMLYPENAKKMLKKWGFVFHGEVEGDPMFHYVTLPEGWKKERTDHSMWSKLLDQQGRERASIFYKAAFYDRSAHLSLTCRYGFHTDYDRRDAEGVEVVIVTDCGERIHETEPLANEDGQNWESYEKSKKVAVAWLDERYPRWRDPTAYWGE